MLWIGRIVATMSSGSEHDYTLPELRREIDIVGDWWVTGDVAKARRFVTLVDQLIRRLPDVVDNDGTRTEIKKQHLENQRNNAMQFVASRDAAGGSQHSLIDFRNIRR